MSTINLEVMKQLLQEFVEKEALTREELKLVQRQIDELETRVNSCHEQLKLVIEDKDKVAAMMKRYGSESGILGKPAGDRMPSTALPPGSSAAAPKQAESVVSQKPARASRTANTLPASSAQALPESDSSKKKASAGEGKPKEPHAQANDASQGQQADAEEAEKVSEPTEEPSEDTVKSINDALRGLFR